MTPTPTPSPFVLTLARGAKAVFAALLTLGAPLRAWLCFHDDGIYWPDEIYQSLDPVEHPVVRTHPESGEESLFVNAGFTSHIKGLMADESEALLSFLYSHSSRPEFVVRYHWHEGDIGFWDNRTTQHAVAGDFGDAHRVIQRVTLRGSEPTA